MSLISRLINNPLSVLYSLPGILIGLTVHEWAHAFSANRLGDPTAKNMGRMTLNPLAHIDLFGFLCLLIAGFGWAKPVPVNSRNFKKFRRDDMIVSLAGIAANLITGFLVCIVYYFVMYYANLYSNNAFHSILLSIVSINISLAIFNLIPVYPLDGSHVFEHFFIRKAPKVCFFLRKYGQFILLAILLLGFLDGLLGKMVNFVFGIYSKAAIALLRIFV